MRLLGYLLVGALYGFIGFYGMSAIGRYLKRCAPEDPLETLERQRREGF